MKHQLIDDGVITAIVGASGSGKTAWLKKQIAKSKRLLVWDIEAQYNYNMQPVTNKADLIAAIKQKEARISYQPNTLNDFDFWAQCAFVFAKQGANIGQKTDIVAEELADVTSPAKAPAGWGMLVRRGRKYGANIYGITQRPAESDKTLFGNCMILHICALQRAGDRQYIAQEADIDILEVKNINRGKLEFIHKNMLTGEAIKSALKF